MEHPTIVEASGLAPICIKDSAIFRRGYQIPEMGILDREKENLKKHGLRSICRLAATAIDACLTGYVYVNSDSSIHTI